MLDCSWMLFEEVALFLALLYGFVCQECWSFVMSLCSSSFKNFSVEMFLVVWHRVMSCSTRLFQTDIPLSMLLTRQWNAHTWINFPITLFTCITFISSDHLIRFQISLCDVGIIQASNWWDCSTWSPTRKLLMRHQILSRTIVQYACRAVKRTCMPILWGLIHRVQLCFLDPMVVVMILLLCVYVWLQGFSPGGHHSRLSAVCEDDVVQLTMANTLGTTLFLGLHGGVDDIVTLCVHVIALLQADRLSVKMMLSGCFQDLNRVC